jgi:hypothetical protein
LNHPRRRRNIALGVLAAGLASSIAAFVLPATMASDTVRGVMLALGATVAIFGGGTAVFRHLDARALRSLGRGQDVLARWHVDADTWRAFVAYDRRLNQEGGVLSNELSIRDSVPDDGVEVIVADTAVQIDESLHRLPRRGPPEVTHAELNKGRVRPSFIELLLYYPEGGVGASGVPMAEVRTALRFPVPLSALADAERVVARYAAGRPGKADFFHGIGDGSDPEDVSTCWACRHQTHQFVSHCPQCGASMQSRRWSRRFGGVLVLCGAFITAVMAAVLSYSVPRLLRPGVDIGGTRFMGSASFSLLVLGIMGVVLTFGVTTLLYGAWQVRSGGRSLRVVRFLIGLVALLALMALLL